MNKENARAYVSALREELTSKEVLISSQTIANRILQSRAYQNCTTVFLYASIHHEVDTYSIRKDALLVGKKVCVPKITEGRMVFYEIKEESDLSPGYWGIPEPLPYKERLMIPHEKSIILVPGVAFDLMGHRCGYGKGFYDMFLKDYESIPKIGLAFDLQIFSEIETNQYDISMDQIYTETRTIERKEERIQDDRT